MLRNMALGLMPDLLRVADGPPPEAHDFLIRGEWAVGGRDCAGLLLRWCCASAAALVLCDIQKSCSPGLIL